MIINRALQDSETDPIHAMQFEIKVVRLPSMNITQKAPAIFCD